MEVRLIFLLVFLCSLHVYPYSFSQEIFEVQNKSKCVEANKSEIEKLKACAKTPLPSELETFDDTSEYLIFSTIAKAELPRLKCQRDQLGFLITNKEAFENSLAQSCETIPILADLINVRAKLQKELDSFNSAIDPQMGNVSPSTRGSIKPKIEQINAKLRDLNKAISGLRNADPLLSSSSIYDTVERKITGGLLSKKMTASEICAELPEFAKSGLNQDYESLKENHRILQEKVNSGKSLIEDEDLKVALWNSYSKRDYLDSIKGEKALLLSTYCRMEGRYGRDSQHRASVVKNLSIGALSVIPMMLLPETGLLAPLLEVKSPVLSQRMYTLARAAVGLDIVTAAGLDISTIHDNCRDKLNKVSADDSCDMTNAKMAKAHFTKTLEVQHCLKSIALSALAQGLTVGSLRSEFIHAKTVDNLREAMGKSNRPNFSYEEVIKAHDREVQRLSRELKVGIAQIPGNQKTVRTALAEDYLNGKVRMTAKSEIDENQLGQIYRINQLPSGSANAGESTEALLHPQMAESIKKLEKMGYNVAVDTSLVNTPLKSYRSDASHFIAVNSQTTWREFKEQFKSVQFKYYIEKELNDKLNIYFIRDGEKKLRDILPEKTIALFGEKKLKAIERLIVNKKLSPDGVNETLASLNRLEGMNLVQRSIGLYEIEKNKGIISQMTDLKSRAINEPGVGLFDDFAKAYENTAAKLEFSLKDQKVISPMSMATSMPARIENYHQVISVRDDSPEGKETPLVGQLANGEWVIFAPQEK